MSKLNFDTMTKSELRAYVLANRHDREAFYIFADRVRKMKPRATLRTDADFERLPELVRSIVSES